MGKELRGIKGKEAIKAFIRADGVERSGKGIILISKCLMA